jgi:hypothetical protein
MSQKNSTALAVGAAIGGAAVAAFLSMGTAHAVVGLDTDGYSDLFGASGTPGILFGQTATDTALDSELLSQSPGNAAAFDTAVDLFQSTGTDHGVTQLIAALDPHAFVVQFDPDIAGYLTNGFGPGDAGGFLVPDDFLGYLATDLDFFLLSPTGLDPALLGPVLDTLLGFPTM